MNNWIILDVDDVIFNFRQSLADSFKQVGIDIPWESWTAYSHIKIYGLPDESALHQHMINLNVLENGKLEPLAKEALIKISNSGYKIGLLTARGWHPDGYDITQCFVEKYDLPIDKVVVSRGYKAKKSDYIKDFPGTVHAYLDDSIHHIEDFLSEGIEHSYLLQRPWNINSPLKRVHNLDEFAEITQQIAKNNNI